MTSKAHLFKNVMSVYAVELMCITGVLRFQTFKRFAYIISCIHNFKPVSKCRQPSEVHSVSFERE